MVSFPAKRLTVTLGDSPVTFHYPIDGHSLEWLTLASFEAGIIQPAGDVVIAFTLAAHVENIISHYLGSAMAMGIANHIYTVAEIVRTPTYPLRVGDSLKQIGFQC